MTPFAKWLEGELNKRGWSQSELVKHVRMSGYRMSSGQLSHIINGTRGAGPDACIAIAHALGVSREEVFRARGWLLREPEKVVKPNMQPEVAEVVRKLMELPNNIQKHAAKALRAQIEAIYAVREN